MDKIAVVIPAAGQGKRINCGQNKQFLLLQGMPIIVHTLRAFQESPEICEIVVVCAPGEEQFYLEDFSLKYGMKNVMAVAGGKERQDSVYAGLKSLGSEYTHVLVHDGARPLVTKEIITRTVSEVKSGGAVVTGVPVKDTVKRADSAGFIIDTIERERLWNIQTPQGFRMSLLAEAHQRAQAEGFCGTDDAALVERLGIPVRVIHGSYENIKITTPEDIIIAEAILKGRENR